MAKVRIHKEKKIFNKRNNNILKYIGIVVFYIMAVYVLEYQFDLPLFVKLGILFGIYEYFLRKL